MDKLLQRCSTLLYHAMSTYDLFAMARANAANLAAIFDVRGAADEPLTEFAERVEREGRLSVTMKFDRLRAFLELGRYRNPWEEALDNAGGDSAAADALVREQQGRYYARRALFDGSFEQGKCFHYGALYLEGRALLNSTYGTYCALFSPTAAQAWSSVAWLPDNSLLRYVADDASAIDMMRLAQDVGPHNGRHHVAGIKHANDIATWARDAWGSQLCRDGCFVEGIVADTMTPTELEPRLLADQTHWQQLLDAEDALLDYDAMTAAQAADNERLVVLREALKKYGFTVEAC